MSAPIAPPTGTVTFLFTDIEGSTKLWEQQPDVMRPALARHDQLLRQAIEENGGWVFKTVGDAFCAAFATADRALAAALAAQLALAPEPWGLPTPLGVRIALHTGACEQRSGDYFGQPLNRVARLMAAGHGGQVLLSEVTQGLIRDALPPAASLQDLGQHRLKDLGRPERVFQLCRPDLPAEFPPLRSLDSPDLPNNLLQQPTSFIGRETEVGEVKALLGRTRLLTLTGAGGSGKTRLSLQVAADLLDGEGDGVWLVELASLADPALVPQAVAQVLGVREEKGKTIHQTLVGWLKPRRLLLVLDNCEHLVAACASLAADLLRNCPQVHVLASSREPLGVSGEQTYRVPSLSLPDPKKTQTKEALSQFEAVALFIERARAVQPSFTVTNANAPALADICWRLDGIPLAIELAAARVRSLSLDEINARLDHRFRLLTGGPRNTLPRQQTLRALIDWSYDLLTENEKTLLRRLSVFAGGWTLAAAEAVGTGENAAGIEIEEWEVVDLLTGLVDKSLVVYEEQAAGGGDRSRLLETVRQYAADRLEESGQAGAVRERAAAWFLALAERAEPYLTGPEQVSWLERLETEHDNIRASLLWYEKQTEGIEAGLRLSGSLYYFWFIHCHFSEGRQWLEKALERRKIGEAGPDVSLKQEAIRAKALAGAGNLAHRQLDAVAARALLEESLTIRRRLGDQDGIANSLTSLGGVVAQYQRDYAGARALYEESLSIYRRLENPYGIAWTLTNLGNVAHFQRDYAGAQALLEESLTIYRRIGNQDGIAHTLTSLGAVVANYQCDYAGARALYEESLTIYRQLENLHGIASTLNRTAGLAAYNQGDYEGARALYEECLTIVRRFGNPDGIANTLNCLGLMAYYQGDCSKARPSIEEGLTIFRRLNDLNGIANTLYELGDVDVKQGNYTGTRALYVESLEIYKQLGDQNGTAYNLDGLAGVAYLKGQPAQAARLSGAASALRVALNMPLPSVEQEIVDERMAFVREALGEEAFIAARDAGRAMTMEQAVEYALAAEQ